MGEPPSGARVTLGIDLASQAANTAVCLIRWAGDAAPGPVDGPAPGVAEVIGLIRGRDGDGPLDDEHLVRLMVEGVDGTAPARIGIDAPLGWPVAFVDAVAQPDGWPLETEVAPVELVRRLSDRHVHAQTGKVPLSVSTDLIAYPAMRAQRLLRRLRARTGESIDRSGARGRVCEVYPDVTATRFGLRDGLGPRVGYKAAAGASVRAQLLERLLEQAPWLVLSEPDRWGCVESDDRFDALLAALAARAVDRGLTEPPPAEASELARREGWIHLPVPDALVRLPSARTPGPGGR